MLSEYLKHSSLKRDHFGLQAGSGLDDPIGQIEIHGIVSYSEITSPDDVALCVKVDDAST